MECPLCQGTMRRFGRNRNGSQRYRCDVCAKTYTDGATRTDRRRISPETAVLVLRMILEGNSVRSTQRLTGVHRDTIIATMVEAGERCEPFLSRLIFKVPVSDVQADEIWGFVGCKERTRERKNLDESKGDAWCFVGIDRDTKLVLAWHLDKRTSGATAEFALKLRAATRGRFQLTTDGFRPYQTAVPMMFGDGIDFAQLVKTYTHSNEEGTAARYSPGEVVQTHKVVLLGNPDDARVCTSHAERQNLTMRMTLRRLTRLTNGHSKKWQNHRAALALYFAYYNLCRVHATLTDATREEGQPVRKTTPAMAAGLTDHVWGVAELLRRIGE